MRILGAVTCIVAVNWATCTFAQIAISYCPSVTPARVGVGMPGVATYSPVTYTSYSVIYSSPSPIVDPLCCAPVDESYYQPQSVNATPIAQTAPAVIGGISPCIRCCAPSTATFAPATTCTPAVGMRAPVVLGQNPSSHYIGRGIVGQPKVFVSGQPLRNALRFITP